MAAYDVASKFVEPWARQAERSLRSDPTGVGYATAVDALCANGRKMPQAPPVWALAFGTADVLRDIPAGHELYNDAQGARTKLVTAVAGPVLCLW